MQCLPLFHSEILSSTCWLLVTMAESGNDLWSFRPSILNSSEQSLCNILYHTSLPSFPFIRANKSDFLITYSQALQNPYHFPWPEECCKLPREPISSSPSYHYAEASSITGSLGGNQYNIIQPRMQFNCDFSIEIMKTQLEEQSGKLWRGRLTRGMSLL
jgi:hypothetical protein